MSKNSRFAEDARGGAIPGEDVTPPKYKLALVAQVILEEAIELHPQHLSFDELALRIVTNSDDEREMKIAMEAISDLKQCWLFNYADDDDVVAPTPAALRAYALLA